MRVLVATQHRGIVGGVETYLRAVLPQLAAAQFEVGVLTEVGSTASGEGILSGCRGCPVWDAAGRQVVDLVKELADWKPDVVYAHGLGHPWLETALAENFPTVLFVHGHYGTCVSGTKCHVRPEYETCHRTLGLGCLAAYYPRRCGGWNPLTMLRLYRTQRHRLANLHCFRAILVASRYMADEYRRHGLTQDFLRIVPLFPPDVNPEPNVPVSRPRSDRVLYVGRITALKGLHHLITAIPVASAELGRRLTLVVAGEGPDRTAIEAEARRVGVAAEFLGWIDPNRREREMRAADVLAVPSLGPETFGLVGVEAGCVGLPSVGYATGGITDWLIPGVSGETAPGDKPNPKELASALVRALRDDRHLHRLRLGAWETAGRFTLEAHMKELVSILEATAKLQPAS